MEFSVLMSVYYKENPIYLKESLDSVFNSSLQPKDVVVVEDGPIPKSLSEVLDKYPQLIRVKLSENLGLGLALNNGLELINTDLVARMDTDDICSENRFEVQINKFKENPKLVLLGSHVAEFENTPSQVGQIKRMPLVGEEIKKYSKLRNPFNHPTVMFKKSALKQSGAYKNMPFFEDYYLWLRLLSKYPVYSFANIDEPLVLMRTNEALYNRRGGFSYISKILYFRRTCVKERLLHVKDAFLASVISIVVSLAPNRIRKKIYIRHLRK